MRKRKLSIGEIIEEIVRVNEDAGEFWSNAYGWAPQESAELLSKSRLDRQVSLSRCLRQWLNPPESGWEEGHLILGWVNLGALVEGTLKLLFCVHFPSYIKSVENFSPATNRNGDIREPDALQFEYLIQIADKDVWLEGDNWTEWLRHIQSRRNAIHAYKDREIGTFEEFWDSVREYLQFIQEIDWRIPRP